ncbi:MAG: hypothetical protein DYH13_03210 [Alphaproteobacteria bacterium PRO2]|nr:hypothetical protein [Alphaproteobacteria bacterium PRO2]
MARQRYYFSDRLARKQRNTKICLAALLFIAVSAGTAWSRENVAAAPASMSLPLSVTDTCLPPPSICHAPQTVTDKTQRPAGTLAALDPDFGVRLALDSLGSPQHILEPELSLISAMPAMPTAASP